MHVMTLPKNHRIDFAAASWNNGYLYIIEKEKKKSYKPKMKQNNAVNQP